MEAELEVKMPNPIKFKVYRVEAKDVNIQYVSPPCLTEAEAKAELENCQGQFMSSRISEYQIEVPAQQALAEQDKRTRHAIAEAVMRHLQLRGIEVPGLIATIMNCAGGLEDPPPKKA